MPTSGYDASAFKQELNDFDAKVRRVLEKQAQVIAYEVRDMIKARIPPGATSHMGMSATFPGYAATGKLKRWIRSSKVTTHPTYGRFTATVGLPPYSPKKVQMYFWVHEFGRVIRAKPGGYLVFRIRDKWVKVKQVTIKEKKFFRSAWEEAQRQFPDMVYKHVRPRWPV